MNITTSEKVHACGILPVSSFHFLGIRTQLVGELENRTIQKRREKTQWKARKHGQQSRGTQSKISVTGWGESPVSEFVSFIFVSMKDAISLDLLAPHYCCKSFHHRCDDNGSIKCNLWKIIGKTIFRKSQGCEGVFPTFIPCDVGLVGMTCRTLPLPTKYYPISNMEGVGKITKIVYRNTYSFH